MSNIKQEALGRKSKLLNCDKNDLKRHKWRQINNVKMRIFSESLWVDDYWMVSSWRYVVLRTIKCPSSMTSIISSSSPMSRDTKDEISSTSSGTRKEGAAVEASANVSRARFWLWNSSKSLSLGSSNVV